MQFNKKVCFYQLLGKSACGSVGKVTANNEVIEARPDRCDD
jgi:hypothetical protein